MTWGDVNIITRGLCYVGKLDSGGYQIFGKLNRERGELLTPNNSYSAMALHFQQHFIYNLYFFNIQDSMLEMALKPNLTYISFE